MNGILRAALLGAALLLPAAEARAEASGAAPAPLPPHGHIAALRGIRIYYEDIGRGPVLVLLHGGAGSGEQFKPQIPFFSHRRRLILPDACAQGRSTDREGPLTYHAMAEDLVALLDFLKIRRADILGWSDGGVVGLDVAMNHRQRIRRLVVFGANFSPDGLNAPDVLWNNTATAASFGPEMEKFYKSVAPDTSHYVAAMEKVIRLWREEPKYSAAELGKIRCRTLIAAGEHDVIREEHTRELAQRIPGAALWIVPNASHSVLQEAPGVVNPVILKFLGGRVRKKAAR